MRMPIFLKMNILNWIRKGEVNETAEKKVFTEINSKNYSATYGPKYVTIDITNRCNLNCIVCWTYSPYLRKNKPSKTWYSNELSFDTVSKLINDLKKLKTREIRLTGGGEPFMHPDIFEIIELIKEKGFVIDITTNFTLLSQDKIRRLVSLGVDNLTISLWAATQKTYVKTHPRENEETFERLKSNIVYLNKIKKNTKVVIANVLSKLNYHEAYDMVSLAKELGSDEVYFAMMDPVHETRPLLLSKKEQKELKMLFLRLIKDYGSKKFGNLRIDNPENILRRIDNKRMHSGFYDSNIIYNLPCTIGYTFSRIMANGDVAPCCKSVMIPTGNINRENFIKIWNSQKQMAFRKIGLDLKSHPGFVEKVGCLKTCDNLMQNIETYEKMKHYKNEASE